MIKLNIQLFAEESEEAVDTSTETKEEVTNQETTDEEKVEFTDTSESKEEKKDSNVEDAQAKQEAEEKAKQEQLRKAQNKEYAERRLREKQEREQQRLQREAYVKGLKATTKGVNPYNNKPLNDEFDIKEYETMLEMEKKGLDPVDDYAEYVKQLQRESKQKELEQAKANEEKQKAELNNIQEFVNKYGFEQAQKLNKDKDWIEFSNMVLANPTMTNIYEAYLYMHNKINKAAEKAVNKAKANAAVQTGKPSSLSTNDKIDINKMTDEEFRAYSAKIRGLTH